MLINAFMLEWILMNEKQIQIKAWFHLHIDLR